MAFITGLGGILRFIRYTTTQGSNACIECDILGKFVNRKLEKGGWSVPRAPVILLKSRNPNLKALKMTYIDYATAVSDVV
jgi:hypothetical protein